MIKDIDSITYAAQGNSFEYQHFANLCAIGLGHSKFFICFPSEGRFCPSGKKKKFFLVRFFSAGSFFFSGREGSFLVKKRTGNENKTWNALKGELSAEIALTT